MRNKLADRILELRVPFAYEPEVISASHDTVLLKFKDGGVAIFKEMESRLEYKSDILKCTLTPDEAAVIRRHI